MLRRFQRKRGAVALNDGKRSSKFPWGQVSEWWHQIVDEPYPALESDSSSALFRVFGAGLMSPHDARATKDRIMLIICFVSYKGGSGKSTAVAHFSVVASLHGYRVVVVDLDPQQSLATWASLRRRHGPHVVAMRPNELAGFLETNRSRYDLCVIDTPGHDWSVLAKAAAASDLSIIVSRPTLFDVDVAISVRDALIRHEKPCAFLLTQVPPRASSRLAIWAKTYEGLGTIVDPPLASLFGYQDALAAGLGVSEYQPGERADREIRSVYRWIVNQLGAPK